MSPAAESVVGQRAEGAAVADLGSTSSTLPVGSKDAARDEGPPDAALLGRQEGTKEEASSATGAGAWQRTLQQVPFLCEPVSCAHRAT